MMDGPLRIAAPVEECTPGFIVSHQRLEFEIDFVTRSITGRTEITILPQRRDIKELRFHARQCQIHEDYVKVNGRSAEWHYDDFYERMDIPDYMMIGPNQHEVQKERIKPLMSGEPVPGELIIVLPKSVRIEDVNPFSEAAPVAVRERALSAMRASSVAAHGGNITTPILTPRAPEDNSLRYAPLVVSIPFTTKKFREGLFWVGLDDGDVRYPHTYTRHSNYRGVASCIFPCYDSPHMRCSWEIMVKCPKTLGDALRKPVKSKTNGVSRKDQQKTNHDRSNGDKSDSEFSEFVVEISKEDSRLEMNVVSSGELIHETPDPADVTKKIFTFATSDQVGPQHIGFSCGPFEQVDLGEFREEEGNEKLGQKAVVVTGYCLPGRSNELRNTCETMAFAVDWFALNFGSYPFPDYKVCFVDDQVPDTVPLAAFTLCSSRMLFPEDIIDPEVGVTRKLIHALASQWIGVRLIAAQRMDTWVIVGVSYFITDMCMKKLCGNNDYRFRQKANADKLVDIDFQRPSIHALGEIMHLGDFEMEFMILKAPLVLFILDQRLTKLSGSTGINRVISRLSYNATVGELSDKMVTTEGFRRLCEKIGHYKLDSFFNQWVLGAGCPRFQVTQKFNKKKLAVEMTISQKQETMPTPVKLEKDHFLREFKEEAGNVYAGEVQPVFTGPMTIRIHESDGTPYEHIVEIREGVQKIEIPYHTKYKRLKRSRREKERATAGPGTEVTAENHDDVLLYCLGDVLQSKEDIREFGLVEWDAEMEAKMEQESYEWIRMDADFEWICELTINMPSYMFLSQLQQDRDVVAQQDSMLFLGKQSPHPLVSTILVRTLYDKRYFWGIREMACRYLADHGVAAHQWIGRVHLEKCFQRIFCYKGSSMPKSNDFSNKTEYLMKLAIPKAMARVRNTEGKCPREARQFILDLLKFNDNGNNEYSDYYYICNLMEALTNSLIPVKIQHGGLAFAFAEDEDEDELTKFQKDAVEEIERYRRMDEWILSYQNIYTRTALRCKRDLMKAKIIPQNPAELFAYTHDGTMDPVRIEAFDSMADLGYMSNDNLMTYFLKVMSTDASPYVRHRLYDVLFLALASVALGEYNTQTPPTEQLHQEDADGDTLIVEVETEASQAAKKALVARTTSIEGALKALKQELKDNAAFRTALWEAIRSPHINAAEQVDLLDVCSILYDAVESLTIKVKLPRYWQAKYLGKGKIRFRTTSKVRTKPLAKLAPLPSPVKAPPRPQIVMRPSPSPAPTMPLAALPTPVRSPSITLSTASSSTASAMKPPPKRPVQIDTGRPRLSKIVKLYVPSDKLRCWPRGRGGPARSPLPGSRPKETTSNNYSRPSPSPSFSLKAAQRDGTLGTPGPRSSSNKVRVPLPSASGRTPLPGSTKSVDRHDGGYTPTASVVRSESPAAAGTPGMQKKPSLKLKFTLGQKKSMTPSPAPSTPRSDDREHR